jgi:hypothetical protein
VLNHYGSVVLGVQVLWWPLLQLLGYLYRLEETQVVKDLL